MRLRAANPTAQATPHMLGSPRANAKDIGRQRDSGVRSRARYVDRDRNSGQRLAGRLLWPEPAVAYPAPGAIPSGAHRRQPPTSGEFNDGSRTLTEASFLRHLGNVGKLTRIYCASVSHNLVEFPWT